jgi:hypothetical protein
VSERSRHSDHEGLVVRAPNRRRLCWLGAISVVLSAPSLFAQTVAPSSPGGVVPADASAKDEARRRFDRGLSLYNAGDLNGALAEFRHVYRLTAHLIVLYNLALVHAGLGNAAQAVEALEKLQSPAARAELGAERAERARKTYEEQLLRVGSLEIKSSADGAQIQIDGIDVAKTPAPPLRVTAGTHVVSLSAPRHEPRHVGVTVAGRAVEVVEIQLTPVEEAFARLTPVSSVPDVEVRANGELVGRTPFESDLAFRPGTHELEFTRFGYVPVRRRLRLDPGSVGRMDVSMVPSDTGLATGGTLAFSLSETNAVVTVDGQVRLDHTVSLRLPLGRHTLRIQRAGFFDVERDVSIRPGYQELDATLLPTPTYLAEYVAGAENRRFWSYIALGSGALVVGASVGFLIWNQGEKNEAEHAFDEFADEVASSNTGSCTTDACASELGLLVDELDARRDRDVFGWAGVGVGALAVGTGILLFVTGPDPGRYEPKQDSDLFGRLTLRLRGTGVEASGTF